MAITMALGLASRKVPGLTPAWLGKYPGDILWATMAYFLFAFLFPRQQPRRIFTATLIFSITIEFLKLYHAPWIVAIRSSTAGALVFGHVFTWENLIAYAAGAAIGFAVDNAMRRRL